jgi:hypothetical protein
VYNNNDDDDDDQLRLDHVAADLPSPFVVTRLV